MRVVTQLDHFANEMGCKPHRTTWAECEEQWLQDQQNALDFEATQPLACLRLRYEDFLQAPERITQFVCTFLRVEWQPAMADPYSSEAVGSFQGELVGDAKLLRRKAIDKAQANKWRKMPQPQPLMAGTREMAKQLDCAPCPRVCQVANLPGVDQ